MGQVGEEEEFEKKGVAVEGMPRGSVPREGGCSKDTLDLYISLLYACR